MKIISGQAFGAYHSMAKQRKNLKTVQAVINLIPAGGIIGFDYNIDNSIVIGAAYTNGR